MKKNWLFDMGFGRSYERLVYNNKIRDKLIDITYKQIVITKKPLNFP
jgi:hypothetical protein